MDSALQARVQELRRDHEAVAGEPFNHFVCPTLFRDEPTELCKGHIVPEAFGAGPWTVQRKDIDGWFGTIFESQFADYRHRDATHESTFLDDVLAKRLRPRIEVDGRVVEYYVPRGPVPAHHSAITYLTALGSKTLALKISPEELSRLKVTGAWRTVVEYDLRLSAFVTLLKAGHLTMFDLMGYKYALSPIGRYLGSVLGSFYEANAGKSDRQEILANARVHFNPYTAMVRQLGNDGLPFEGTAFDHKFFFCVGVPAILILVQVGSTLNGVLIPNFREGEQGAFDEFLKNPHDFKARAARQEGEARYIAAPENATTIRWPREGCDFSDPL